MDGNIDSVNYSGEYKSLSIGLSIKKTVCSRVIKVQRYKFEILTYKVHKSNMV